MGQDILVVTLAEERRRHTFHKNILIFLMKGEAGCPWISYEHRQKFLKTNTDKQWETYKGPREQERERMAMKSQIWGQQRGSVGKHKNAPGQ
ncbi:hypothetical protein E2C01_033735 [Portunus trituberculatus]|uniref:Uncharacterized protein n=1 Tax=Portunus trituberculatus TaxID=210409 RepID=A0A5B7F4J4_PORTR|nr:hypothetical protein [Portunus trituberculatus]